MHCLWGLKNRWCADKDARYGSCMTDVWPVRPAVADDKEAFLETIRMAYGTTRYSAEDAVWEVVLGGGAALFAHEPGAPHRVVGCSVYLPTQLALPGGQSPNGQGARGADLSGDGAVLHDVHGLSWVAVRPDRRRRGVLTAMMASQLAWARDHQFGWSATRATEAGIYARFGYGCASTHHAVTVGKGALGDTAPNGADYAYDLSPVTAESIAWHRAVWVAHAQRNPGTVVLDPGLGAAAIPDAHDTLHTAEPRIAVLRQAGQLVAAAYVEREDNQDSTQIVRMLVSVDDAARVELARQVSAADLVDSTRVVGVATDDPLLWSPEGPRRLDMTTRDGLWVRPVHLDVALRSLQWRTPIALTLQLSDPVPGTAHTVTIRATEPGPAEIEVTDDKPDLTIPSALLGALSLGGFTPRAAARYAAVTEHRLGAATKLAVALRGVTAPCAVASL